MALILIIIIFFIIRMYLLTNVITMLMNPIHKYFSFHVPSIQMRTRNKIKMASNSRSNLCSRGDSLLS